MSQSTSEKNTADFMSEIRAQAAAQDARQDAQLASILVRKKSRIRKIEAAPNWLVKNAPKKVAEKSAADKFNRKKPIKPKR